MPQHNDLIIFACVNLFMLAKGCRVIKLVEQIQIDSDQKIHNSKRLMEHQKHVEQNDQINVLPLQTS